MIVLFIIEKYLLFKFISYLYHRDSIFIRLLDFIFICLLIKILLIAFYILKYLEYLKFQIKFYLFKNLLMVYYYF